MRRQPPIPIRRALQWRATSALLTLTSALLALTSAGWAVLCPVASHGQSTGAQRRLEREVIQQLGKLESDNPLDQRQGAEALLQIDPRDVGDPELRKDVAQAFRKVAFGRFADDEAIEGLVHWGGKHSVPLLIELLERNKLHVSDALFDALARYPDPRSAEALAGHLGNFHHGKDAERCLRKFGPVAEPALIEAAPSADADVSLAAVELLGHVGTDKSMPILRKAMASRNRDVREVASASLRRIRQRMASKESSKESDDAADDSPFEGGSADGSPAEKPAEQPDADSDAGDQGSADKRREANADAIFDDAISNSTNDEHVDRTEMELLLPSDVEGSVVPDGAPAAASVAAEPKEQKAWQPKPVRLTGVVGNDFQRAMSSAAMVVIGGNVHQPRAAAVYGSFPFAEVCRVEIADLKRRKSTLQFVGPTGTHLACFSPDGSQLLLGAIEDRMRRETRLSLRSTSSGDERFGWTPHPVDRKSFNRGEISWAEWISDVRLLTVSSDGTTTLWDVAGDKAKAIYQIDGSAGSVAALSPGRGYYALTTPRGLEVFGSADGKLLAKMNADSPPGPGLLTFDATGTRLALVRERRVTHWNAVSGQLLGDFYNNAIETTDRAGQAAWLSDDLLAVGTNVVDLTSRAVLWRYGGPQHLGRHWQANFWSLLHEGNLMGLIPVRLPHPAAMAARAGQKSAAVLELKRGTAIAIDNQIADDNREQAEKALADAVTRRQLVTAADAQLRLIARIGKVETEQASYRRFGESLFSRGTDVTVETGRTYEAVLEIDGKEAWSYRTGRRGFAPMHVRMKEGESIDAAVQREAQGQTALGAFALELPPIVVLPDQTGPLGTSQLTFSGVE